MPPFADAIRERVLLCDGAIGTMLYARGAFVNRPFDELNTRDPTLVLGVHQAYVEAGVDIVQTNTFGANRLRLSAFGLDEHAEAINRAGVEVARRAVAGSSVSVAGSIGPLGVMVAPRGQTTEREAMDCFGEQARTLAVAGVDLFVLETFRSLDELVWALRAVCTETDRPVVAQVALPDTGVDSSWATTVIDRLRTAGAAVVGVNCGAGAAAMLEALEQLHAVDPEVPLAAQPNAGLPREVDGRTMSLSSPDYLASYARRFAQTGARLIGGCCGTTPEHIARIREALSAIPTHA